jgi:hypothetical protein
MEILYFGIRLLPCKIVGKNDFIKHLPIPLIYFNPSQMFNLIVDKTQGNKNGMKEG